LRVHLGLLFPGQLDRLRHFRQCQLLTALRAESDFFSLLQRFANYRAIQRMEVAAKHGFIPKHRQVSPRKEALEQTLEEGPHRRADLWAEAEHEVQFAVGIGLLPESAQQPVAHLVARVVLPLGRAGEGVRVAQQHDQRSKDVLRRAGYGIGHTILGLLLLRRLLQIDQLGEDQVRLQAERIGFAETDVVLEKQQRRRVQEHVALARGQIP